jgi:hypothetical protein
MDGVWGLRTAQAVKALLTANGRAASMSPPGPLPWITEAQSALGRHEVRDRSWLMDWLKRDGRSLGDPSKIPWCGDFVETCEPRRFCQRLIGVSYAAMGSVSSAA